jgi:hypothetical protein
MGWITDNLTINALPLHGQPQQSTSQKGLGKRAAGQPRQNFEPSYTPTPTHTLGEREREREGEREEERETHAVIICLKKIAPRTTAHQPQSEKLHQICISMPDPITRFWLHPDPNLG